MRMRWGPRGTTSIIVSSRRRETMTERVAEWKLCLSLIFPVFPWVSHVFSLVFVNLLHLVSSALQVPLESGFPSFTRIPGVSLPPGLPCLFFPLDQSLTVQVYPQWISCMYVFPEYVILPQSYPEIPSLSESLVKSWFFLIWLYPRNKAGGGWGVAGIMVFVSLCPALPRGCLLNHSS